VSVVTLENKNLGVEGREAKARATKVWNSAGRGRKSERRTDERDTLDRLVEAWERVGVN
jgi:hypothetical protein